jgi:methyl-accepting chemotaxis protein
MSGLFANLKINAKLGLGFAIVLALLIAVGATAGWGLRSAGHGFDEYTRFSRRTVALVVADRDIVDMRSNVLLYVQAGDEKAAARVRALAAELKKGLAEILAQLRDRGSRAKVELVAKLVADYADQFEAAAQLRTTHAKLIDERMNPTGAKARQLLTDMIQGALADKAYAEAAHEGVAQESLMLTRVDALHFVASGDANQMEEAHKQGQAFIAYAGELLKEIEDPRRRGQAREVATVAADYLAVVDQVASASAALNKQVYETMAKISGEVGDTITTMRLAQIEAMDDLQARTSAETSAEGTVSMMLAAGALAIGVLLAWLIGRGIADPVKAMTAAMRRLADGDMAGTIPAVGRTDEVGQMAKAVQVFKDSMIETERLKAEQLALEQRAQGDKRAAMAKLADDFQAVVGSIVQAVSASAGKVNASSTAMAGTAEETARQAVAVAAASEQASTNVQTVAAATDELTASVSEIGRQVEQSTRISSQAVSEAAATTTAIRGLAEMAQKVDSVVKIINDIAGQTNLLALNATIEAARAGDAGKGFAVVASEVKALANQTAQATEEISAQIGAMQAATHDSVSRIEAIGKTIGEINHIATTIASAVEQQSAATQEIARNVQQAAAGTGEVSSNIAGVSHAAGETGSAATQVQAASAELAKQGEALRVEVGRFLAKIRSA